MFQTLAIDPSRPCGPCLFRAACKDVEFSIDATVPPGTLYAARASLISSSLELPRSGLAAASCQTIFSSLCTLESLNSGIRAPDGFTGLQCAAASVTQAGTKANCICRSFEVMVQLSAVQGSEADCFNVPCWVYSKMAKPGARWMMQRLM